MTFRVGLSVQPLRLRDVGQHTWHCSPSTLTSTGVPDARTDMASSRTTRHRDLFVSLSVWAAPRPDRNRNHSRRCSLGRRRRRATAGRRTARPGRIGWQVLVMLARLQVAPRVTTQYGLVGKAELSPFAPSGTSGVRWRAGIGPLDPGEGHLGGVRAAGDQASVTVPPTVAAYSQHRPRTNLR
jgi:hypothetical protein